MRSKGKKKALTSLERIISFESHGDGGASILDDINYPIDVYDGFFVFRVEVTDGFIFELYVN